MSKLKFTKMVAAGNDFIVIDRRGLSVSGRVGLSRMALSLCNRKLGIGSDGLLILERSRKADFKMRIFNADGSEAEMCGNGLRCAAVYHAPGNKKRIKIETMAGIYEASVTGGHRVRIKMRDPKDLKLNFYIKINDRVRPVNVSYIDTGVPHTVIFVEGIEKIDVDSIGSVVRQHREFSPRGTNVDFVEVIGDRDIKMRTYERGVEGETLACGTGAVASAVISGCAARDGSHATAVHTKGGILKVYFKKTEGIIEDVFLEGGAGEVFKGTLRRVYV